MLQPQEWERLLQACQPVGEKAAGAEQAAARNQALLHLQPAQGMKRRRIGEEPLFISETGRPLTENGIALLFGRLRKRAGITKKEMGPALLRDTFAVRYLQAGGDLCTLRALLGRERQGQTLSADEPGGSVSFHATPLHPSILAEVLFACAVLPP